MSQRRGHNERTQQRYAVKSLRDDRSKCRVIKVTRDLDHVDDALWQTVQQDVFH